MRQTVAELKAINRHARGAGRFGRDRRDRRGLGRGRGRFGSWRGLLFDRGDRFLPARGNPQGQSGHKKTDGAQAQSAGLMFR